MTEDSILLSTHQVLDSICEMFEHSKWRDQYLWGIKTLREELNAPCVLAVAGKVKAGKSFLINSLLGVDLAMTGNTETTATINVFKKGKPFSRELPVLCQWTNGKREWKGRDFLESLQGTDETTLKLTAQIERLIFYVEDNPFLDEVTLVDTPGIGADVGEEGDAHQVQTDAYFQLRKLHADSTISLSNSADAIIYLFNTVPMETNFLSTLYDGGHGITSQNGIGVLSKIDKNLEQMNNIPKYEKEFEKELFKILPTSAALFKIIPDLSSALEIQATLKEWFPLESVFNMAIGSEKAFKHPKLPKCTVPYLERELFVAKYASYKDLPWATFALVANRLYYTENVQKCLEDLKKIAGVDILRNQLNEHFFKRSRLLRCNKVLTEIRKILISISYNPSLLLARQYAKNKKVLLEICKNIEPPYSQMLFDIVNSNVDSPEVVMDAQKMIEEKREQVDCLLSELANVNNSYLAYQKLLSHKEEFYPIEIEELRNLFSGQAIHVDPIKRQRYWSSVANSAIHNSNRQNVAKIAKNKYTNLISNE